MSFQLKALREKRGEIKKRIEEIGDKLKKESRAMSSDEKTAFDKLKSDWVAVSDSIKTAEADITALDAILNSGSSDDAGTAADDAAPAQNSKRHPGKQDRDGRPVKPERGIVEVRKDKALAFQAWARRQHEMPLTADHKAACKRVGMDPRKKTLTFRVGGLGSVLQTRAQSLTSASGGATVAPDFSYAMESALLAYSNVRGVCDEFTSETGVDLPYPTEDDTGNSGAILSENTETDFADDTFSTVTFKGFKYTSRGVLVSAELMNDAFFDLEPFIGGQIGIRIARAQGPHFTTGSGSGQPQGIVTAATSGVTCASATAFTADELTRLAFAIDPAYRNDPSFGYMMHDTTLAYALLLKDAYGRPLLRDSYRDGIALQVLNGFPVFTNQYMVACTGTGGVPVTGSKHVIAGAMKKHKVRDVGTVRLRRLDERYAEKDQVGFVAFMRSDSRCINTGAIKYMIQA